METVENKKITWKLTQVKAADIKPNPNNPKIINRKGIKRLEKSLAKFGRVFDGIVNADFSLIDGHSRLELTKNGEETLNVFVPSRQLNENEYKEFNAIFDIAKASDTNEQLLEELFDDSFFEEWDLDKKRAKEEKKNSTAVYPIVPEYDEKYEAIVIVCSNSIDTLFIKNALGVERQMSYKNKMVKETSVVTGKQFIDRWTSK